MHPLAKPAALVLLLAASAAHATERLQLRNGFTVDCTHRETTPNGQTRLFLDTANTNYLDVDPNTILSTETLQTTPNTPATNPIQHPANPTQTDLITAAAQTHNLNTALLQSVINAESGGHPRAVSRTGARGLMQLMPATAKSLGVTDSFAPEQNLRGGSTYLDRLLTRYGNDLALALAAYNAGPGAVDRYHGIPPFRETRQYVARIIREFNRRTLLARQAAPLHNTTIPTALATSTLP